MDFQSFQSVVQTQPNPYFTRLTKSQMVAGTWQEPKTWTRAIRYPVKHAFSHKAQTFAGDSHRTLATRRHDQRPSLFLGRHCRVNFTSGRAGSGNDRSQGPVKFVNFYNPQRCGIVGLHLEKNCFWLFSINFFSYRKLTTLSTSRLASNRFIL